MRGIKPAVEEERIREVLAPVFGASTTEIAPLRGGHVAETFRVCAEGSEYVLRFNADNMDANYEKEAYICDRYRSQSIPIPEVISFGRSGELHYCITRKVAGTRMDQLPLAEVERLTPSLIETLSAIHAVDVSDTEGCGLFDGAGRGFFSDWPSSLISVREEERQGGFYGKWHEMFDTTFLDRDFFHRISARMDELLASLPSERYLVHGGYGFGNVLAADGHVTAVIDWLDAAYGDFCYDVAWLDYWASAGGYVQVVRDRYNVLGHDLQNLDERVLCYQCRIALDGMRFFAKLADVDSYRFTTERITNLLGW
ncbi:MAG: aminoglycoside phosphotransferase family protein [Gemmatimonadota bacterium]|nr:MAG: aminoglycoside phosphotransferase family protein [Gemmatimonadota bacterium]